MNTNASVTIYHYDEESERETEQFFEHASVFGNIKIGDLSHGRRNESSFTVRIPTSERINVSCGDRVVCSRLGIDLTVVGFSDNRRGAGKTMHWKLLLK